MLSLLLVLVWAVDRTLLMRNRAERAAAMKALLCDMVADAHDMVRVQRELAHRAAIEDFANAIPTLAWTARADGYIDWYNARWYEYTGTDHDAMKGWGWQSVHDPEVLPDVLVRWRGSIAKGHPFEMTFPLRRADGQFRLFLTRVVPSTDANGAVVRWFGTNTDVHDSLKAAATLDLLAQSMSHPLAMASP